MIAFLHTQFRRLIEFIKRRNSLQHEAIGIKIHDQGFDVIYPKANCVTVKWDAVNCINGFKRDLFSVDLICLEFYQDGLCSRVEVDEQMEGWQLLLVALPEKFEGFDRDWWSKVGLPAFATNFTEIWRRAGDSPPK